MSGTSKPGIGGDKLPGQEQPAAYSQLPKGEGGNLPTWVAYDKQVLSFEAFFQEPVVERREEQFRVRKCKLYFYLEDDSLQIVEPRSRNSGMAQGLISTAFLFFPFINIIVAIIKYGIIFMDFAASCLILQIIAVDSLGKKNCIIFSTP